MPRQNRQKWRQSILGSGNPNWKGGARMDRGYIRVLVPDHPNRDKDGYIMEHRLIVEQQLGRLLLSSEHIHHKDGNKTNNNLSNLEILSMGEHNRRHRRVKDYLANGGDRQVFSNRKV